jgi:hypothetical protein
MQESSLNYRHGDALEDRASGQELSVASFEYISLNRESMFQYCLGHETNDGSAECVPLVLRNPESTL